MDARTNVLGSEAPMFTSAEAESMAHALYGLRATATPLFTCGLTTTVGNKISGPGYGDTGSPVGSQFLITRTTRYPANCPAPCPAGQLVAPTLTSASVTVPLVAPGTEFLPRLNQLDLSNDLQWAVMECIIPQATESEQEIQEDIDRALERAQREREKRRERAAERAE